MKKIWTRTNRFVMLGCMLSILVAGMSVQASELQEEQWQTVISDDGMIELSLPEDWFVFTQETIPDEALCDEIGLYRDELISYVASMDGGMVAFQLSDNAFISLAREPLSGVPDFRSLTDEELAIVVEEARKEVESAEGPRRLVYKYLYEGQTDPYIVYDIIDDATEEIVIVTYQTMIGQESVMISFEGTDAFLQDYDFQESVVGHIAFYFSEHSLEDVEMEVIAAMGRELGKAISSIIFAIIIGAVISIIIVVCINSAKKKRTP